MLPPIQLALDVPRGGGGGGGERSEAGRGEGRNCRFSAEELSL